jgi:hypothetical protein
MSCFGLLGSFGNKRQVFPFILICELAQEAKRNSTMQNVFSGLFAQPLSSTFPEMSNFIGGGVLQGHGDLYNFRAVETAWLAKPYQHARLFRHRLFTLMSEKSRHLCYSDPGQRACSCTLPMSCPFNRLAEKCTNRHVPVGHHHR